MEDAGFSHSFFVKTELRGHLDSTIKTKARKESLWCPPPSPVKLCEKGWWCNTKGKMVLEASVSIAHILNFGVLGGASYWLLLEITTVAR